MWKIYYGDGDIFSSIDGKPEDAPALGVQVIAQTNDRVGHDLLCGKDYYIWRDRWIGVDIFGLFDFLIEIGLVKFGRTIPKEDYSSIYKLAKEDPDLPLRSGFMPEERRP